MIDFTKHSPSEIRYDDNGVWAGTEFMPSTNPKLDFARALARFTSFAKLMPTFYGRNYSSNNWGWGCQIGYNCIIGGPGFGYVKDEEGKLFRMPHLGNVEIGNSVSIHNNVNIDRGVTGATVVGDGTKIDSLVHIGHNARVGKNVLIAAGAILGGSCEIGDESFVGINATIKNKVKVGRGCTIGMGAIITKDVPDGATVIGVNKILKKYV